MSMQINSMGGVNFSNMQGLDIETALMAVQSTRANLLEGMLVNKMKEVDVKNKQIAALNNAMSKMTAVKGLFGGESTATTTLIDTMNDSKKGGNSLPRIQEVQIPANEALAEAGFGAGMTELGTSQYGTNIQGDTTMGKVEAAISSLKSKIDALTNSQQMDMLSLQSLSNKRNEAFDIMTNFIKKMQDSRSSIIGNMR